MNWIGLGLAIVLGAAIVAGAIILRPGDFATCVDIISRDIVRQNIHATLDPRDVEAEAARTCSGAV